MTSMRSSDWSEGPRYGWAVLFGSVAAAACLGGWYLLLRATQSHNWLVAAFVGAVIGIAVRVGAQESRFNAGLLAAGLACAALGGGYWLHTRLLLAQYAEEQAAKIYAEEVELAKRAVALTKNTAIRAFIAEVEEVEPKEISKADVERWRDEELPEFQAFLEADEAVVKAEIAALVKNSVALGDLLKVAFDIPSIIFTIIALGVAFRLASGTVSGSG